VDSPPKITLNNHKQLPISRLPKNGRSVKSGKFNFAKTCQLFKQRGLAGRSAQNGREMEVEFNNFEKNLQNIAYKIKPIQI
jgi:hypothetical protein